MPKYQELHQILVDRLQQHEQDAQDGLILADKFVRNLAQALEWDEDDIEYIYLTSPVDHTELPKGRRIDLSRSNKDILEKVAYMVDDFWYFGLRLILKSRKSFGFRNRELMFVVPLFVKKVDTDIAIKTDLKGEEFGSEQVERFAALVSEKIQSILTQGALQIVEQGHTGDLRRKFGFLVDSIKGQPLKALQTEQESDNTSTDKPTEAISKLSSKSSGESVSDAVSESFTSQPPSNISDRTSGAEQESDNTSTAEPTEATSKLSSTSNSESVSDAVSESFTSQPPSHITDQTSNELLEPVNPSADRPGKPAEPLVTAHQNGKDRTPRSNRSNRSSK